MIVGSRGQRGPAGHVKVSEWVGWGDAENATQLILAVVAAVSLG